MANAVWCKGYHEKGKVLKRRDNSRLIPRVVGDFFVWQKWTYRSGEGVVFTGQNAYEILRPCSRDSVLPVDGLWTPTYRDVKNMEDAMPAYLDVKEKNYRGLSEKFKNYHRQYVGFYKQERKMIYINAFEKKDLTPGEPIFYDWHRFPQVICDGGDDLFGMVYDVQSGKFGHFCTNGDSQR